MDTTIPFRPATGGAPAAYLHVAGKPGAERSADLSAAGSAPLTAGGGTDAEGAQAVSGSAESRSLSRLCRGFMSGNLRHAGGDRYGTYAGRAACRWRARSGSRSLSEETSSGEPDVET
ncbi:MAG: hypothetical protein P8125_11265 [Gemmatimonadota bacterium]